MSFLNRTIIPTAGGLNMLTVPLVGGRENKEVMGKVKIDNSQNWQTRQWRTITSAYRRSPWFEFYEPALEEYFKTPYDYLYEWNLDLFKWTMKVLGWQAEINLLDKIPGDNPQTLEKRTVLKPSSFQTEAFTNQLPVYSQVFQDRLGFQPNVSIMDLIFNEGNNSRSLLVNAFD